MKMQIVLWFAGLRGAIAFALSENMPGPNRDTYMSATLTICLFTTVVCGGFTETILSRMGMKQGETVYGDVGVEEEYSTFMDVSPTARRVSTHVYKGFKGAWKELDNQYLKKLFGGSSTQRVQRADANDFGDEHGDYELGKRTPSYTSDNEDEPENGQEGKFVNGSRKAANDNSAKETEQASAGKK